jgi:hypothetical protein
MIIEYYVSPEGQDSNSGSLDQPFASIEKAQSMVRSCSDRRQKPITVFIRKGTYYLDETIKFSVEDSGTEDAPVTYSAYHDEKVVLSGGTRLSLDWQPYQGSIQRAKVPAELEVDQLFINSQRKHMARYPNYDPTIKPYDGYAEDAFSPERAAKWENPAGGYIHAMHAHHWGGYHYRITGKNSDGSVAYEGGWQNNRQMGMHEKFRFVENIFEELDAPGEWYFNKEEKILYYFPDSEEEITTAKVEVARLKHLVEFNGTKENPIQHLTLNGLIFRHTARTFMETKEPLLRSDWTIYRGGALLLKGTEDCVISNCEFDQVGGNGIFVSTYTRGLTISGTHIHEAGASGICFVGDPDTVRNPLFEYQERQNYADIDKTPGPKGDNFPSDCLVEDCLINGIGVVEKQATGVQVSMSQNITIRSCSIYDVGRAGINFSEGTFGGHIIEHCDVFDTVLETGDHGSFNSWGRDRFWELEGAPAHELESLALLDTKKTIIRNSRWRCDHGWDVDLDDGSSNYEIYNNLLLGRGLKFREGFHRQAYNNVTVTGTFHPHAWYENSLDVVTRNIWMRRYRPAGMKHWGKEIDKNFFTIKEDREAFLEQGCDENSLVGDPLFINPEIGDYRVEEDSPVLKLGFKNFPMDQFGVKKTSLKKIARVPKFPLPDILHDSVPVSAAKGTWLGATIKAISGEEFSAFGVRKEDGGIHLITVPPESDAAKAGFQANDLVQFIEDSQIKTLKDLQKRVENPWEPSLLIRFVRGQQVQHLKLKT